MSRPGAALGRVLSRPISAWEAFLFAPRDAAPLAALRIALGLYLVFYYLRLFWFLDLYLFPPALLPPAELPDTLAALPLRHLPVNALSRSALFALALLSALGLCLGLNTRTAALVTWALNRSFAFALVGRNSGDQVVSVLTFLLCLAALGGHAQRVWSLDARGRALDPSVPAWSLRLFQLQLVLVYFFSGFHKLSSGDWYRGEALYYVFQQTQWLRVDVTWVTHPVVIGALSYGVLLFELVLFPVLVWLEPARRWVLALGFALHLGISLVMRVFVFGEIMPIFYLCFVEPRGAVARGERLVARLLAALRRPSRA